MPRGLFDALGLTPVQRSSGGNQKLGQLSRGGRKLLVIGVSPDPRSARGLLVGSDAGQQAARSWPSPWRTTWVAPSGRCSRERRLERVRR